MNALAAVIVVLAGLAMAAFGAFGLARPDRAAGLLRPFAQTLRAHLVEQALRLLAGAALIVHAPRMAWPPGFALFGWVLVVTSLGLLLLPWHWHRRFADWAVPFAIRRLRLYAFGALLIGLALLWGVLSVPR